jgi:hypothetical protein
LAAGGKGGGSQTAISDFAIPKKRLDILQMFETGPSTSYAKKNSPTLGSVTQPLISPQFF